MLFYTESELPQIVTRCSGLHILVICHIRLIEQIIAGLGVKGLRIS